ncbi:uncharacterized protein LOC128337027 isoform X3 [Hemicordylus capensis]|uniref:uncharacterized protein LOC128337027 isoform X3 n=1 Tax=Hemicordylus capensis TaxID=884348 RepID=UPI0023029D8B|nr:uncharacterized protein LOC128337027 isoform X3 [Hemicordylus capensis]
MEPLWEGQKKAEGPLVVPFPQKECQGCCCYSGTIHRPAQSSPESEGGFGEAPFAEGLSIFLSSLVRVVHTDPIAEADCMKVEQQWRKIQILAEKDSQDMLVILQYFGYFWHNTEEEPQCFQQKFCKATMNLIEAASASRDGIAILTSIMLTVYKIGQVQPLGENVERCLLQKVLSSFAEVEADSPSECSQPVRKKAAEALQIVLRGWLREDSTTRHLRGLAKILDGWIHHLEHGWVRELCFSASSALLRYASTMPQIDMEWVRMTIAMPLFSNFQREKWRIHEGDLRGWGGEEGNAVSWEGHGLRKPLSLPKVLIWPRNQKLRRGAAGGGGRRRKRYINLINKQVVLTTHPSHQ